MKPDLRPISSAHAPQLADLWNAACGPDLAITERFTAYNEREATGAARAGQLAFVDGEPAGFVQVSAAPSGESVSGWVDAIAVAPSRQRLGLGSQLLAWGESWLAAQGCLRVRLGGGLRPYVPGLPDIPGNRAFFESRGYHYARPEWDVSRSLSDFAPTHPVPPDAVARQATSADLAALDAFLLHEFPGRWHFEFQEFLRESGRPADYFLLWVDGAIAGFGRLTFEDSERPIDRFYPNPLSRPWGQLGPLGVARSLRGRGYGGVLVSAALKQLRRQGVDGCIIDWTNLLDFYAVFGFRPHRQYGVLIKELA